MSGHTPGPWRLGSTTYPRSVWGSGNIPIQALERQICEIHGTGPINEADARLIAAAPELLEACRASLMYLLVYLLGEGNRDEATVRLLQQIDEAMIKAQGAAEPVTK